MRTVAVSGGFDPLHPGHLALFRQARTLGDRLVVIVESDAWVARKHRVQQTQRDRAEIVAGVFGVDTVLLNGREDGDCSELVIAARASVFAVGRDHQDVDVIPEYAALTAAGVKIKPILTDFDSYRSSKIVAAGEYRNPIPMVAVTIKYWFDGAARLLVATRRDNGKLELPGGFVEVGERPELAAEREVREELGFSSLTVGADSYRGSHVGKYRDGRDLLVLEYDGRFNRSQPIEGFVPTDEVVTVQLCEQPPAGEWDSEIDFRIAQNRMGW